MADKFQMLIVICMCIAAADRYFIHDLQRRGKYDVNTHKSLFVWLFLYTLAIIKFAYRPFNRGLGKQSTSMPIGTVESFKVKDRTLCMDKKGLRTRLTYFLDENNHAWFKEERVTDSGKAVGKPFFEPATVAFRTKAGQLI